MLQGIVYMDRDVLGWRPIAKSWLEDRTHQEVHVSHTRRTNIRRISTRLVVSVLV